MHVYIFLRFDCQSANMLNSRPTLCYAVQFYAILRLVFLYFV